MLIAYHAASITYSLSSFITFVKSVQNLLFNLITPECVVILVSLLPGHVGSPLLAPVIGMHFFKFYAVKNEKFWYR